MFSLFVMPVLLGNFQDESEANKDLSQQSKRRQTENIIKMLTERRLLFSPPETESLATYLLHIHALFPMAEMVNEGVMLMLYSGVLT